MHILSASKMRILYAFKMRISGCVKNAKFAHKKSYNTVCLRSCDSLCAVSYCMYKILLLWLDDYYSGDIVNMQKFQLDC